ncbi:MAG: hypothetical protein ACRD8O_08565 [Bryobacteraceae bacterium]
MRHLGLLLLSASLPSAAFAQPDFRTHNFTASFGAGQPRADLRNLYSDSFLFGFNYGYRFHPLFQLDAGLDTVFGAAGVRDFLPTVFGDLRIRDHQFLAPFGGRAIIPIASDRIQIFGGGGGTYFRYSERIRQPSDFYRIDCSVCASRDGFGYYALAGANFALDHYRHFRLGASARVYRGHTSGDPLGAVAGIRTRDHWVNLLGEFTFSFGGRPYWQMR